MRNPPLIIALLGLLMIVGVATPGNGLSPPPMPTLQKVLVFTTFDGAIIIEALGAPDAQYEVVRTETGITIGVFSAEGSGAYDRLIELQVPPDTPYVEALLPAPDAAAEGDNHTGNCTAQNYCADLHVICLNFCLDRQTWHGMQVHSNAPTTTDPSTTYYKYSCDTGISCTQWLETYLHPAGVSYGSLHCVKHFKPPGASSYYIWSRTIMGGNGVDSNYSYFTGNSANC